MIKNRLLRKIFVLTVTLGAFLLFIKSSYSFYDGSNFSPAKEHQEEVIKDEQGNIIAVQAGHAPEYAPDEFIVKFKPEASQTLKEGLNSSLTISSANIGISSIQVLNQKHGVISVEPVYKGLHKKLRKGETIQSLHARNMSRFPVRAARAPKGAKVPDLTGVYKIKVSGGKEINHIISEYNNNPNVEYAEPNYLVKAQYLPNDPYFQSSGSWGQAYDDMWGLKNIQMEQAWDIALSSPSTPVTVAVVDSGVDYTHEDLSANMWVNDAELNGTAGVDDDGNGYVDDYYGYDMNGNDSDPMDDNGHGTHVAGTIAAVTNNGIGVSGIALNAKVMALKGLNYQGSGYTSDLVEAMYYATDNGADIQNYSWGGFGATSKFLSEAIQYVHSQGCVIIAAAGNFNDDIQFFPPASIKEVISVASTNFDDVKSSFSNWGLKIDVAAPGGGSGNEDPDYPWINILSLRADGTDMYCSGLYPICDTFIVGDNYYRSRGTSMAAPHVSGLAALILSKHPEFSNEQVRQVMRVSADDLGDPGFDINYGYGRINAYKALQIDSPCTSWIESPGYHSFNSGVVNIAGTASGDNFQRYILEYGEGENPDNFNILFESTNQVIDDTLFTWDTESVPTGIYTIRLTAEDTVGNIYEDKLLLRIDHLVEKGWPYDLGNWFDFFYRPTFADLDGDGDMEIIAPTFNKMIYAFHHDGTVMDGWPVTFAGNDDITPPAIGDIDNNGKLEIFINTSEGVDGFDYQGNHLPGWPKISDKTIDTPVVLEDIDRDGYLEVVYLGRTPHGTDDPAYLYALKGDGSLLFSANIGIVKSGTSLAIGNIDQGNNALEIVVPITDGQNAKINVYDYQGNEKSSTNIDGYVLYLTASIGDVNDNGDLEIVYITTLAGNESSVGVLDKDGNQISEWVLDEERLDNNDPVLGNLDADNDLEIIISAERDGDAFPLKTIYAWNYDGSSVDGWPIEAPDYTYTPVLADIDGDGDTEIISSLSIYRRDAFTTSNKLYAFHNDGASVEGWPIDLYNWPMSARMIMPGFARTAIGDLDNDGKLEFAAAPGYGLLYVVELPGSTYPAKMDWPTFRHDPQHTGNYEHTYSLLEACFAATTPTSGYAPLNVTFTDCSVGSITGWQWDFGDETSLWKSTGDPVSHVYDPGDYTVSLTVSGPGGEDIEVKTDYIHVNPVVGFECTLVPESTVIHRLEELKLQATLTNHTSNTETVQFGTRITMPNGTTSGYVWGPFGGITLGPDKSISAQNKYRIPKSSVPGTYIYRGYVGIDGTIIHDCEFTFEVVEEPLCECSLSPGNTIIPKGGKLSFQATVISNSDNPGTVQFGTKITRMANGWQSGFIWGPFNVFLQPKDSISAPKSHTIPTYFPLGTYTYHGYVGVPGIGTFDECQFVFEVTQ